MNTFIVIPAYNEASRIGGVLKKVQNYKLPIIVVDDGSRDNTFEVSRKQKNVTVLRHRTNLGKGAALKTGCEAALSMKAEAIVIMDSDGQHKVSDLPKFIEALDSKKYDVIFGSRNLSMGVPLVRFLGNKFASVLINVLFGIYVSDLICGYRAFTKKGYKILDWQSRGYGVETEMVIKTGKNHLRYCEVTVETVYFDKFKGVTLLDAFSILFSVFRWRISQ